MYKCVFFDEFDRDTHLYRSFCACTNVSFLMNLDRDTHLYSSFYASTNLSFLMNSREIHICTAVSTPVQMCLSDEVDRDTH